ncbi:MAG: ABC transporter ATP-binding protein, partial [Dehalococcoidales bacterium]
MLKLENIGHHYGNRQVLKNINLEVARGELFGLIGPTGAGKTTLLRIIDLLETPASGVMYFDGAKVAATGSRRLDIKRRMAFVLQKPVVFNASVYDNIAVGLRWRRQNRSRISQTVEPLLEVTGLKALKDKNARTLSGGEAQRVAIARAVAVSPELLLLDEPTANLDPVSTLRTEEMIADIYRRYRTTIIMTTHDLAQGRRLAGRIGVLVNGEMVQAGKAEAVFSMPHNRQVAEFVGMENIVPGVVASREGELAVVDLGGTLIEAVSDYGVGGEVYALIRPEEVMLAKQRGTSSARNWLAGVITGVDMTATPARVNVDCGFPLVALVTRASLEEMGLKPGQPVYAGFKATGVHIIERPG